MLFLFAFDFAAKSAEVRGSVSRSSPIKGRLGGVLFSIDSRFNQIQLPRHLSAISQILTTLVLRSESRD